MAHGGRGHGLGRIVDEHTTEASDKQAGLFEVKPLLLSTFQDIFRAEQRSSEAGAGTARVTTPGGHARGAGAATGIERGRGTRCKDRRSGAHTQACFRESCDAISALGSHGARETHVALGLDFRGCATTGPQPRQWASWWSGADFCGGAAP